MCSHHGAGDEIQILFVGLMSLRANDRTVNCHRVIKQNMEMAVITCRIKELFENCLFIKFKLNRRCSEHRDA